MRTCNWKSGGRKRSELVLKYQVQCTKYKVEIPAAAGRRNRVEIHCASLREIIRGKYD